MNAYAPRSEAARTQAPAPVARGPERESSNAEALEIGAEGAACPETEARTLTVTARLLGRSPAVQRLKQQKALLNSRSSPLKQFQPGTAIQRKGGTLTASAILAALANTQFTVPATPQNTKDPEHPPGSQITLADKLRQSTSAQQRDRARDAGSKETMQERVDKILSEFTGTFSGSFSDRTAHAVMLSIAMDGVAKVIADELYDPALKPQLAKRLFELYAGEMKTALTGTADLKESFTRAKAMSSHDPIALFMHDELRKEDAASQIRQMAKAAKLKAQVMFDALKAKFQAELASYSLTEVKNQEDTRATYNVKESTGEYSETYFSGLFAPGGLDPTTQKPTANAGSLQFSGQKLQDLEQEVMNPTLGASPDAIPGHLSEVAAEDSRVMASRQRDVEAILMRTPPVYGIGGLSLTEARKVISTLKAGLPGLPLTITVSSLDWFGAGSDFKKFNPSYRAASGRRNKVPINEVLGKPGARDRDLDYLGKWTGQAERGEEYLKFRSWKDRKMVGNRTLADADLPVYGAVNANWRKAYGSEAANRDYWKAQARERGVADYRHVEATQPQAGLNYYGDMHFMLDKTRVLTRLVYTATDHGRPHTDLFLMLADFLTEDSAGDPGYKANLTGVKKDAIKNPGNAARLIAAALKTDKTAFHGLPFEVQIFGGVSLATDVEAVYVAPAVPHSVLQRMINAFGHVGLALKVVPIPEDVGVDIGGGNLLFSEVQALIDSHKV